MKSDITFINGYLTRVQLTLVDEQGRTLTDINGNVFLKLSRDGESSAGTWSGTATSGVASIAVTTDSQEPGLYIGEVTVPHADGDIIAERFYAEVRGALTA